MLKEDYIMRLFQLFNESLAKWLSKRKADNSEWIVSYNNEVVKPYLDQNIEFFETKEKDTLIEYFQKTYVNEQERFSRLEILAEALFQRAMMMNETIRQRKIFSLTLELLLYVHSIDKTYSVAREYRMEELQRIIQVS